MNTRLHRKLEALIRVRAHCDAHPDPDSGWQTTVAQLRNGIARAERLAARQLDGRLNVRATAAERRRLRARLHRYYLVVLARIAKPASREEPGLTELFRLPDGNGGYTAWRIAARRISAEARAREALFISCGLTAHLLDDLDKGLDELEALLHRRSAHRNRHVGATAGLAQVIAESMQLMYLLDGLNQHRLRTEPGLLAAWKSARYLGIWKRRPRPTETEKREPDSPPPVSPAPSSLTPLPFSLFPVPCSSQLA